MVQQFIDIHNQYVNADASYTRGLIKKKWSPRQVIPERQPATRYDRHARAAAADIRVVNKIGNIELHIDSLCSIVVNIGPHISK